MKWIPLLIAVAGCGGAYSVELFDGGPEQTAEGGPSPDGGLPDSAPALDGGGEASATCGQLHLSCCVNSSGGGHTPEICNDPLTVCNPKTFLCEECGRPGEYCCMGACAPGSVCWIPYGGDFGCYTCGGLGQPCCDPNRTTCNSGLKCRAADLVCIKPDAG